MEKFSTIVIDDEEIARLRLRSLLEEFPDIEIVTTAFDGIDAVEKILNYRPELIFLDIEIPGLNGFEVLDKLDYSPFVIFTTAYDEYALKAFDTFSVDYLVKPINSSKLQKAVKKLHKLKSNVLNKEKVEKLLTHLKKSQVNKRLAVKSGDDIYFIKFEDVFFLKSDKNYTEVYTYDNKFLLSQTLGKVEVDLSENFKRVHKSYIINIEKIAKITKWFRNQHKAVMKNKDGTKIPINKETNKHLDQLF